MRPVTNFISEAASDDIHGHDQLGVVNYPVDNLGASPSDET
jgi:hypothetical protein